MFEKGKLPQKKKSWEVIGHTVPTVCHTVQCTCGNTTLLLRDMLFNKQQSFATLNHDNNCDGEHDEPTHGVPDDRTCGKFMDFHQQTERARMW